MYQNGMGMPMNMGMGGMGMPMNMGMGGMGMPMNMGMGGMGMMNMNNMMMGMGNDEEWMKGFKMGVEEVNNSGGGGEMNESSNPNVPKINIIFKTTQGVTHTLVYDYGTTIDEVLKKYLKRVNRSDLINVKGDKKICFLFNASQLKFGDQTKVEDFFKNITNPKVVVNDVNNLIGA